MKLMQLIDWYERLTPERLAEIGQLYHETATFRDPFNQVRGQCAIEAVFRHMYRTTEEQRFDLIDRQAAGDTAWLRWIFHCRLKGRPITLEGATRLIFGGDGRVLEHRDYWDATDLFLQLPLLGTMVQHLKQRLSAPLSGPGDESDNHER